VCGRVSATNPCSRCGPSDSRLDRVVGVAEFEGVAREAVHALKYEEKHAISGLLGRLMAGAASHIEADLLVHAALHPSRRRERGYDQSALLARHMARELDIPFDVHAVTRTRKTRQQVRLGPAERNENLAGAFSVRRSVAGMRILVVDDVYTTGSTIRSVAAALHVAGAASVAGVVWAVASAGIEGSSPSTRGVRTK
jgi:ComF family protein